METIPITLPEHLVKWLNSLPGVWAEQLTLEGKVLVTLEHEYQIMRCIERTRITPLVVPEE